MEISNSEVNDLEVIFDLYARATKYMISKNQVSWPEFPRELIEDEIKDQRQWKLTIDSEIAGIWATALDDELIWGKKNNEPSVYLHRIAINPAFRGRNLVKEIVLWADDYCRVNELKYVRMDTVGFNEGLIKHYKRNGFEFLGVRPLESTEGLPAHYKQGDVCFFERGVG